ncbi:MAG: arginase family protein [bacterium]|nr:arginase family protein [bacterium]
MIKNSQKLLAFDVVELNPRFDIDNQTAKLASSYIAELIF